MTNISINNDITNNPGTTNNKTDYNTSILIDGCNQMGISLSKEQVRQFVSYYCMLYEKNKVMNLTAVTDWNDVQIKHFLDSLLLKEVMDLSRPLKILDLGTGAGFPGIPLKIAFENLDIVLADSLNKRIRFLDEVIATLGLNKIETVHARAEDLGRRKGYRESFDLVVSRAVANLSSLTEYCMPFVKTGGYFVSYKSSDIEDEMRSAENAVKLLGGGNMEKITRPLPFTDVERSFVVIKKEKPTPARYPRKAGTPSKDPL